MNQDKQQAFNLQLTLEQTIYTLGQLQHLPTPQVALAGRSNVGKSSLINCLANRKRNLAKISSTPGKTRSLNYYKVQKHELYLVDLPGYGYARCSKTEREKWAQLIDKYLTEHTEYIKAVGVLLDCRHDPQQLDLDLISYLHSLRIPIIPVLTKADKCKQGERTKRKKQWKNILADVTPILFSSKTGLGRDELWRRILAD